MSIQHFAPGDIIDISPVGGNLEATASATLIRENHIEVFRFVLKSGKSTPEHTAAGDLTIQCLQGVVELTMHSRVQVLEANQLVYLKADDAHTVKALADSVLLITILLRRQ